MQNLWDMQTATTEPHPMNQIISLSYYPDTGRHMSGDVREIVEGAFALANRHKRTRGEVTPVALLLLTADEEKGLMPYLLPYRSPEEKAVYMLELRALIAEMRPDVVVFLHEAWMRRTDTREEAQQLLKDGGPVGQMPGAFECLMVSVETYDGTWKAVAKLTGQNGTQHFEPPVFGFVSEYEGQVMNFLPPQGAMK